MKHITEFKRWKELDEKIKDEYEAINPTYKHVTPKERKLKLLAAKTKKPESYWKKLSSKSLGAILKAI